MTATISLTSSFHRAFHAPVHAGRCVSGKFEEYSVQEIT